MRKDERNRKMKNNIHTPSTEQDEELNRVIALFKLCREMGYTLRIIPGTPEQNAPVFDFETETIIQPAA